MKQSCSIDRTSLIEKNLWLRVFTWTKLNDVTMRENLCVQLTFEDVYYSTATVYRNESWGKYVGDFDDDLLINYCVNINDKNLNRQRKAFY